MLMRKLIANPLILRLSKDEQPRTSEALVPHPDPFVLSLSKDAQC
jgi:hypothetical protein